MSLKRISLEKNTVMQSSEKKTIIWCADVKFSADLDYLYVVSLMVNQIVTIPKRVG